MKKTVVLFSDAGRNDLSLVGGKGANLGEMTNLGIPVPPGFTISTEVCNFYQHSYQYPDGLEREVMEALRHVEQAMEARFGDAQNPLLLSVRSGARVSMPGMMDTILNLGLNDATVEGLIKRTNNPRFGYDCYRRLVAMYGDVVLGLKPIAKEDIDPFEELLDAKKKARGAEVDTDLTADDLRQLVGEFKQAIKERTGQPFPENPLDQLWGAIGAVFKSWDGERAVAYRRLNNIPDEWGTAVNIQSMVYGNMGENSATGVAFTRNPATGAKELYGEFLVNAQGEDVVAGIRTPLQLMQLKEIMPEVYAQFEEIAYKLETHYRDMQDIEFTVQNGRLWILQTRRGKRTGFAAFRIAVDMVEEGLIDKKEALLRVEPDQLNQLLRPIFDMKQKEEAISSGKLLARGLNAGPGAASGRVVFNSLDAVEWKRRGEKVILARIETSPEDIKGMDAAEGILTQHGGMTSHAALVARQMGRVCVVGAGDLEIDYRSRCFQANDRVVREGDWISIDGSTGEVILGKLDTKPSEVLQVLLEKTLTPEQSGTYRTYHQIMSWADENRRLGVWANADQPEQAANAIAFGAEGIGLCRTEHMFFGGDRINAFREMILAADEMGRRAALRKLLPFQKEDFAGLFKVMGGRPVIIRTLDPPLHEFLPHSEGEMQILAGNLNMPVEDLKAKVESLREANPMLGHRGCRLGIVYPEITEMQAEAILEAACEVTKTGVDVNPEIMIPLVGHVNELRDQDRLVRRIAAEVFERHGVKVNYKVGTMIELPRAAITADQIAEVAEFFSFGTNDLTQTASGLSRDDSARFLPVYKQMGILPQDPFATIDEDGIGRLMEWCVERGRATRPDMEIGICGEHGGDPSSIRFCHGIGLDYVSCSPFRLPIARLAAAQAALSETRTGR
ncbi:pyruvate, phosphate dikinase [Dehalococcoidia bacterium]|nr:pyruvate, phosphate dikinase [Dehalococcoidia bacterium]